MSELDDFLRCPRCRCQLKTVQGNQILCANVSCEYATVGFPKASGQPVLIDFERSIFEPNAYTNGRVSVLPRENSGSGFRARVLGFFLSGRNRVAERMAATFLARVKEMSNNPMVLVVGGGVKGSGTEALYSDSEITLVGTDVYASPYTKLVADGHSLPFDDASFEGVWIQAVLEYVLDPNVVVAEIHRVLKPSGVVYADTPFMQQVHMEAYDFTRFTLSGHRWLFRHFEEIDAGVVAGAGTSAFWALLYLCRALGGRLGTLLVIPFFWMRFLDGFAKRRPIADAASSIYFFGVKSDRTVKPRDMVGYYQKRL